MGMQFMDDAIWQKLQQGIVSPEEAYMKCIERRDSATSFLRNPPAWQTPAAETKLFALLLLPCLPLENSRSGL